MVAAGFQIGVTRVLVGAALATAVLLPPNHASAQYGRTDHVEGAISTLKRCSLPTPRGDHHTLIVALRALEDPALEPFYEALLKSSDWRSRIDGILGLAELSKERDVNIELVLALPNAEDRSTAIRAAIGFELLKPKNLRALLDEPNVPSVDALVICGELHRQGQPFPANAVRSVSADPADDIAGLASLLLMESGDDSAWKAFVERWSARSDEIRNATLQELARVALLYRLKSSVRGLGELARKPNINAATLMMVNATALGLEPKLGARMWGTFVERERSQALLLRAGLQLLAHEAACEAGLGAKLRNGEPLVDAIADAIDASVSRDPDAMASALEVVIDRANKTSAEWAIRRAASLPAPQATRVWKHLIDAFLGAPSNAMALSPVVLDAATRLAESNPALLEPMIRRADGERQVQEVLLLALCNASSAEGADVAERVRGQLSRRGDALALLAIARGRAELTPQIRGELGIVAAGGGDLDQSLLAQAAWLFVKSSGRQAAALEQMGSP
jgi:hypothetical protein